MNIINQQSPFGRVHAGFTLIELLVAVLIIGILAAVAVAQYEKAVWKARAAELRTVTRALAVAQESFFLANGVYPRHFDEMDLDVSLSVKGRSSQCGLTTADSRGNERYELIVNNNFSEGGHFLSSSMFITGPFKCGGFTFVHLQTKASGVQEGRMYCWENAVYLPGSAGSFCSQVMNGKYVASNWGYRMYELP